MRLQLLVGNDVTGAGVADDVALVPTIALLWDSASKAFGLNMEKKLVKLKNGITFISQKLDNVHSVTISVNFKVGSLYEDQINNGITHLIEHLFF